ncbi:DMT family transporter [Mycobacterium sp.]|uniref:DMT family transporter n=1 Tax=Mycobacterium sp. TaxID=1785 RepID=UPI002BAC1EB3|nr:DMT family transporter [Mycobacterium sp.]HTQ20406.1 DMT family transporter [Mycobacterium sp.]
MAKVDIAVVLALLAAFASAVGNVFRQRSAQEITDTEVGHLELFGLSLRDTRWWLGAGGAVANYVLQAAALALGSVVLVTALQVTALLFALPIYAYLTKVRVTRREWAWAVLLAAALAVVVTIGDPGGGASRGSPGDWIVVALVMGPLVAFCLLGARVWKGTVAAVLLAVAAGSSLALFAVLTKAVVEVLSGGVGALLLSPEFYFWLAAMPAGMIFQQSAYRAGSLTAALPTSVVAKPLVGSLLGMLVLGETFHTTQSGLVVVVVAVVLVIVATVALARGEAENVTEEAIESGRFPVITDPRVIQQAASGSAGLVRSPTR